MAQYNVGFDFTQPIQIVFTAQLATAKRPVFNQLITNRDPVSTLILGFETERQIPDFSSPLATSIVDPLSSVVVDGTVNVWAAAVSASSTPSTGNTTGNMGTSPAAPPTPPFITVDVVPTSLGSSGSPLAIATAIAASGLPLLIAQQMASSGISILGNPVLLYGNLPVQPAGAAAVGVTLDKQAYNTTTSQAAYPIWDGFVSRPMNTVVRLYYQEGSMPSAGHDGQDVPTWAAAGFKVLVTLKPWRDGTNTYGTNTVPGQGSLTYAQELTALQNAVSYLQGAATNGLEITLWHEANNGGHTGQFGTGGVYPGTSTDAQAAANYADYWNFYAPAITGNVPTVTLVYVPGMSSPNSTLSFYPGKTGVGWTLQKYAPDYYCSDYALPASNPKLITLTAAQAQADADSLAFGLWEWGVNNSSTIPSTSAFASWAANQVLNVFAARLAASKTNADIVWFAAPASYPPTGANVITASSPPEYVTAIQQTFDALSNVPSPTVTVAAGATSILVPNSPSPGASYAVAKRISYDITINATAGVGSTKPFLQVKLQWFNNDSPGAQQVAQQHWSVPMGNAGGAGTLIQGAGPQNGQFLQISLTNSDTVTCGVNLQLNSTSRSVARHNWYWDAQSSVNIPTYTTPPAGGGFVNSLGAVPNVSVPASGSVSYLMSMFAGQVWFRAFTTGGGSQLQYTLQPQPSSLFGGAALVNQTPTGEFGEMLVLPRGPCQLTITNTDAGAAHGANVQIVALD